MAIGAAEYTELVASTLEEIKGDLVDQVITSHPTLDLLNSEVKSDTGRALVLNLEGAEDNSTAFTDASGTFSTTASNDVIGAASFDWSSPLVSKVRVVWKTLQMNQGKHQIVDLLKAHINAAKKNHAKTIATALHARMDQGYDNAGGPITGQFLPFDAIISNEAYDDDPKGDGNLTVPAFTVGGIDAGAAPFWNGQRIELALDNASYGTGNIRKAFRNVRNELSVANSGQHEVTNIICGRDIFEEFEDSFDGLVRYLDFGDGQTRFRAIMDGDIEVRLDPDCPAKRAYFIDKSTWHFRNLNGNFMTTMPSQAITGTLDFVTPLASVLSVGTDQRRANAVLLRPTVAGGDA